MIVRPSPDPAPCAKARRATSALLIGALLAGTCPLALFSSARAQTMPPPPSSPAPRTASAPGGVPGLSPMATPASETALQGRTALLSADAIDYDRTLGIVTARGRVQIAQGSRLLLADTISFSEKTNVVIASGHVSLLEPTGETLFANYLELTEDLSHGFIEQARLLMADNSKFAALEGERIDGRYTRMENAVYSPCELCAEDPTRPPIWQIRASRITHDQEAHDINYVNPVLEIAGVPVFWLPFFGHPDPTVERRSGFLSPKAGFSSDIGTYARIYYFFNIDDSKDFTLEVTPSAEDGLLLGGEYRQRLASGSLTVSGSLTRADRPRRRDDALVNEKDWRGHLFAVGRFEIDDTWRWGFDLRRVTDNSHLLRYDYSEENILASRGFAEWFNGRDYFSANVYDFQDLRPGNRAEEPVVLPSLFYEALGQPGTLWGGRWSAQAGALSLLRSDGTDSRRLSGAFGWRQDAVASFGVVSDLNADIRADGYWASQTPRPGGGGPDDDALALRLFPSASWRLRYPLAREIGTTQQLLEPTLMLSAAPRPKHDAAIINEDSQDVQLDYTNVFRPSRYPGIDRLEGGQRLTYGLKTGVYGASGGSSTLFLGQSYRLQSDDAFPPASGLRRQTSDLVGKLELTPNPWLDIGYSFRYDSRTFAQRLHDVYGSIGTEALRLSGSYIYLDKSTQDGFFAGRDREELSLALSSALSEFWSVEISHRHDFSQGDRPIRSGASLTYQDECLTFQMVAERNFTRRTGIDTGNRFFLRVVFKNLGEFLSPSLANFSETPQQGLR
jgi:LPS-assembly protein